MLTRAPQGNPRPRRLCRLHGLQWELSGRRILGQGLGRALALQEPGGLLLPPPWAPGTASAPFPAPVRPQSLPGASTFARLRALWVELQAGRALAGVVALGVDADAAAFTDSGFPLTFVHVCNGKERVMDACGCRRPSRAGGPPCFLAWKHLEGPTLSSPAGKCLF